MAGCSPVWGSKDHQSLFGDSLITVFSSEQVNSGDGINMRYVPAVHRALQIVMSQSWQLRRGGAVGPPFRPTGKLEQVGNGTHQRLGAGASFQCHGPHSACHVGLCLAVGKISDPGARVHGGPGHRAECGLCSLLFALNNAMGLASGWQGCLEAWCSM